MSSVRVSNISSVVVDSQSSGVKYWTETVSVGPYGTESVRGKTENQSSGPFISKPTLEIS